MSQLTTPHQAATQPVTLEDVFADDDERAFTPRFTSRHIADRYGQDLSDQDLYLSNRRSVTHCVFSCNLFGRIFVK